MVLKKKGLFITAYIRDEKFNILLLLLLMKNNENERRHKPQYEIHVL